MEKTVYWIMFMNIYRKKRRKLVMYVKGEKRGENRRKREKGGGKNEKSVGGKVLEKRSHFTKVNEVYKIRSAPIVKYF